MMSGELGTMAGASLFYVLYLFGGHYFFQTPRHILTGHEITLYGCFGLVLAEGVMCFLWGELVGERVSAWALPLATAILLTAGGALTWGMHALDRTNREHRELEAYRERQEKEARD